ncbi:hypothetical protein ES703_76949 [subsurface metagenome]
MPKMNVNLYVIEDYENEPPSGSKKTNPNKPNLVPRRRIANELKIACQNKYHSFRTLPLALAAFFIKFLVEANQKGWRREPADKMCLSKVSKGRVFMKGWNIKKLVFLLIVYLGGFMCKSTTAPPSYNNPTKGVCETSK